jgi:hypothetical protein
MHNPVGQLAGEHPNIVKAGRVGWLAKGIVYVVAGVLALSIASKASGWTDQTSTTGNQEASPTGALKSIAGSSGGGLLLWLLAIGMLLYAAWRLVSAALPGGHDAKANAQRAGFVVSAIIYTTFAITAISLARSSAQTADGNSKVSDITFDVMKHTGGRLLIGLAGAIVIAAGLYRIYKGVTGDVNDELDLGGMAPQRVSVTKKLGAIGEAGRGVGIGLVGFFLLRAAITFDANESTGLDGALRRLVVQTWGVVVVIVVGVGFVAYGVFCVATFTHRRLQAPG